MSLSILILWLWYLPVRNSGSHITCYFNIIMSHISCLRVADVRITTQPPPHAACIIIECLCLHFLPVRCRSTTTNTRHPSTPHPSVIIEQRRPHFCRRVADAQPPTQLSNTIERHRPHFAPERCQRTTNNTTSPPVLHASSLDVSACIFVPARCQSTTNAQPPTQLLNTIERHRPHF